MGETLESSAKRIEQLDERTNRTEEKVAQLDKSIAVYSAIFEKNLQIQEKLSTAIDRLAETINSIQQTLVGVLRDTKVNTELQQSNSQKIGEIEATTGKKISELEVKLHSKISELDTKLNEVDDKGKFDFLKFIRENLLTVTLFMYIMYDAVKSYLEK
jgi:chromosome segregation ATPase